MRRVLAIGFLLGLFSTVPTGAADGWGILFAPRVVRSDTGLSYHYRIRSLASNRGDVAVIRIHNRGRMANLLTPEIWEDPGDYVTELITFGIDTSLTQPPIVWSPWRVLPFPYTLDLLERELQQGRRSLLPENVKEALRVAEVSGRYPPHLFNAVGPGGTSPEFGILNSADLPGIIAWDVISTFPADSEVKDSGFTVGPELNPDDMSLIQQLFRLQNLVEEGAHLGWIGEDASEKLVDRARSARRKLFLRGAGDEHNAAAWAKLLQFRDDLRRAREKWNEETREEREDWNRSRRVRRGREREADEAIPFIPRYDDEPIGEDAADDRAWALLEPNVSYLLNRLAPPRAGEGRGPGGR